MSHQEEIKSLRQRREALIQKKTRAEATRDSLQKELDSILKELKENFGIKDLKELPGVIKEKEAKLAEKREVLKTKMGELESQVQEYEDGLDDEE